MVRKKGDRSIKLLNFINVQILVLIFCIVPDFLNKVIAQTELPPPTTNQGTTDASTIVEGAMNGSKLVVDSFNKDWQDLASGNSPVYTAIVKISLLIATISVALLSIGLYEEIANYGLSTKVINELVYPTIVVLMLAINNGALLTSTSLLFRETSNYLNQQILGVTRNGIRLSEAIREVNMDQAFAAAIGEKLKECSNKSLTTNQQGQNARRLCQENVLSDAEKQARDYRDKYQLPGAPNTLNPLKIGEEIVNSAVQALSWIIFSGLEAAFQFGLQMSFMLNAYVGPIFLVLSLLPLGTKPIYAWLSGWLALALTLISYSIIVGIAATAVVNAPNTNPLFFQLVEAILSPILALAIGIGGGMSLFSGFVSSAKLLFP